MSAPTSITSSPMHSGLEWRKRSREVDNEYSENIKRPRYQYYYVLENESPAVSEDEGSESFDSIQDATTDYAKDTSDTDTKSEQSEYEVDVQIEYDVGSSETGENPFADGSSSGMDDVIGAVAGAVAAIAEQDWGTNGTGSDTDTGSVASLKDTTIYSWQTCRMCRFRKPVSCFPLCSHCYKVRKNCLPPRPRHTRRKKEKSSNSNGVTKDKLRACLSSLAQESASQELKELAWDQVVVPHTHNNNNNNNTTTESATPVPIDTPVLPSSQSSEGNVVPATTLSSSQCSVAPATTLSASQSSEENLSPAITLLSSQTFESSVVPATTLSSSQCSVAPATTLFSSQSSEASLTPVNSSEASISSASSLPSSQCFEDTFALTPLAVASTPVLSSSQDSLCFMPSSLESIDSGISLDDPSLIEFASSAKEPCIICHTKPKNGVFVHATGVHQCCCYNCAVKHYRISKRCPLCNRVPKNVLKSFF